MMNLAETWKKIPNYDIYFVSNKGRVKSVRNGKETYIFQSKNDRGYLYVSLYKNNIRKNYRVHRLVAEAFLPNPNHFLEVNHIDEIKTNNHVENLEWCDSQYNHDYSMAKEVGQYINGVLIRTYKSLNEMHRQTGYSMWQVGDVCYGRKEKCYGFEWKYLNA